MALFGLKLQKNGKHYPVPPMGVESDSVELVQKLTGVALSLAKEQDRERLLETILEEAKAIANADGGTLYFLAEEDELQFAIVRTSSLNIAFGGSADKKPPFRNLKLYNPETGEGNYATQSVFAVLNKTTVNIPDVYDADGFNFEGTRRFDKEYDYRTCSVITVPMINHKQEVMGCLQLINAKDRDGNTIPFSEEVQELVEALAAQASVILDNKQLIEAQENLLESFIQVLAKAIDAKSPYTGAHCERVPTLTMMLAKAGCSADYGIFKDFDLNEDELYELHVAGWLHDCGKVSTPVHIMDKATKLETIHDRIESVKARFEILKRDAEIDYLKQCAEEGADKQQLKQKYEADIAQLEEELAFIEGSNIGGEFMADDKIERLKEIAARRLSLKGDALPLLSEDEVYNLSIRRGTINDDERKQMNDHMVHTCTMLEALPFPKHLRRVPEYACGHHERMDGKGYPKGIPAGDMSIPARMMAVADVFEALTAADRPYKPAKKLSEAMHIIGIMKKTNHLDPNMVDLFVKSKVYMDYAKKFLDSSLIDEVDEEKILTIAPEPMN